MKGDEVLPEVFQKIFFFFQDLNFILREMLEWRCPVASHSKFNFRKNEAAVRAHLMPIDFIIEQGAVRQGKWTENL